MSFAVAAIIGSTVLGAGVGAYSAHEANKNQPTVDQTYQRFVNKLAKNDAESSTHAKNLYEFGGIKPYSGKYKRNENGIMMRVKKVEGG